MSNILAEIHTRVAQFAEGLYVPANFNPVVYRNMVRPNRLQIPHARMKEFCAALPKEVREEIEKDAITNPQATLEPLIYMGMTVRVAGGEICVWRIVRSNQKLQLE